MVVVAAVHAAVLITLDAVLEPVGVGIAVAMMAVVDAAVIVVAPRRWVWPIVDVVSHLTAGVVIWLDGGTESPFFFWVLLFLAGQALRHRRRMLSVLAGVSIATYVAVVAATGVLTAANTSRFGLLVAFCATLVFLRRSAERHETAARRLDALLRSAADAAPIGVVLFESDLRPVYTNSVADDLLVQAIEGGPGTRVVDASGRGTDLLSGLREGFEQPMAEPETIQIELRGSIHHVRVMSVPVNVEDSTPLLLVFAEDVTEQVAAGEERTRFLQAAAHQFRTPLTPVMAYAQMLAEGQLPEGDAPQVGRAIYQGARDLERVLEKVSALLRLRSTDPPLRRGVTMEEVCATIRYGVAGVGADIEFVGDLSNRLLAAPNMAAMALSELVRNGAVHGEPPVTVRWRETEGVLEIEVRDAGPGPLLEDGADLAAAWGAEYRRATVSEKMGTQLGLAEAAVLSELAGGTLTFHIEGDEWRFVAAYPVPTEITPAFVAGNGHDDLTGGVARS